MDDETAYVQGSGGWCVHTLLAQRGQMPGQRSGDPLASWDRGRKESKRKRDGRESGL